MRDSFVFYRSFYEAISELPDDQAAQLMLAVAKYALDGIDPDLSGVLKAMFLLIKPQIDANNNRYEKGKGGGRPASVNRNDVVELHEQGLSQSEIAEALGCDKSTVSRVLQNCCKTVAKCNGVAKPNVNVNVNVNDNGNDNVNTTIREDYLSEIEEPEEKEPSSGGGGVRTDIPGDVLEKWGSCGMEIDGYTADTLADLTETYSEKWVTDAIVIAADNGVKTIRYVKSILERWRKEGGQTSLKADRTKNRYQHIADF